MEIRKNYAIHIIAAVVLAAAIRLLLLAAIGPQFEGDTGAYLRVAGIMCDTGTFSDIDMLTGKLAPYAYRMPLFQTMVAGLMKLFGADIAWPLAFLNVFLSVCAVLLAIAVMSSVSAPPVAIAAGYMMALNPNSVFNSVLLMTDPLFSFFSMITLLAGVSALKRRSASRFFLWGLTIGVCAMVRPILKFYWIVPFLLTLTPFFEVSWKRRLRCSLFAAAGVALLLLPWSARNWRELGFFGLELNQGVNTLWSTVSLVRPSTPEQRRADVRLAEVRDIVSGHSNSLAAECDVRKKLGLSLVETSSFFTRLGLEVALGNPVSVSLIYLRNLVNIVTSPTAVMELAKRLRGKNADYFPHISVALRTLDWETLTVNLGTRLALVLMFLVCAPLGARALWRGAEPAEKLSLLLMFASILYTVFLTSMVAGYDRYRLSLDPLFLGFAAAWFIRRFSSIEPAAVAMKEGGDKRGIALI